MSAYTSFLNRPLTGRQRGMLAALYSRGYRRAVEHFATDDLDEEDWRHTQCRRMAGVTIKEAKQAHFKALRGFGFDLCGDSGKAFADALALPEQETEFWRGKVREVLERWSPEGLNNAYAAKLIRDKFKRKDPAHLSPWELEQTFYTLNNRGKAKQERRFGEFDGSRRNKKQRASSLHAEHI